MEGMHFLRDLLIAFAVAGVVVFLFHRLRLPSVVGLLAAGVLAGPHGLALIRDPDSIQKLSDIGVVVLLFAVGLDRGALGDLDRDRSEIERRNRKKRPDLSLRDVPKCRDCSLCDHCRGGITQKVPHAAARLSG